MLVLESLVRRRDVRELAEEGVIVLVRAVAELVVRGDVELVADQHTGYHPEGDVDYVIAEPPTVREAGEIAAEHAERVLGPSLRRGNAGIEPKLLRGFDVIR